MTLKRIIPYVIVAFFLFSCYQLEKPKKPNGLISKSDMVNIIVDLKLLASVTGQNTKVLDSNNIDTENFVFQKYNIDSTQFAASSDYYAYNLQDYIDIYEKVKDSLEALSDYYKDLDAKETSEKEPDEGGEKPTNLEKGLVTPVSDK